jgi:formylglycine-generating enzyme required for sulfatase activity
MTLPAAVTPSAAAPPAFPPPWADAWGDDVFGLWADIELAEITQRLRWIPPGQFLMGSPDTEPERVTAEELQRYAFLRAEGPQHPVTLSEGFWLADTACTQALWQVVMSDNPSRFQDNSEQPVETVSWDAVQGFLTALSVKAGVTAVLPTEAQWEYACRAGTTTPFWWGAELTPAQANYDGNYPYHNGQRGEYRVRTVPVKSFQPNPWGLWQMHGNVWEWCQDAPRTYAGAAQLEPAGQTGDYRALRGGSWNDRGGILRSAYRSGSHRGSPRGAPRDYRYDIIGFRWLLRSL